MSFDASLSLAGKTHRLLHVSFALSREVDTIGRPSGQLRGGTVTFEIEATDSTDLWNWMCDPYKIQDGTIQFNKRDSSQSMVKLEWQKGYIIAYSESFDSHGENPMTIQVTVSAKTLSYGGTKHDNPWPI